MDEIEEVRRTNLLKLIDWAEGQAKLAERAGIKNAAQVSQWKNRSPNAKTGRPRAISSDSARSIESKLDLPRGWMDSPDSIVPGKSVATPTSSSKPKQVAANDADWAPVTAYAQAVGLGDGSEAQEYAETHALKFKASSLRKRGIYGRPLAVYYGKGDSMEPTIKDGDAIMFDTSDTRPVDGLLYVIQVGREILVKRAEILDGIVYFRSDNPHGDHAWRKARRMDAKKDPIHILGRVHWIAGWAD